MQPQRRELVGMKTVLRRVLAISAGIVTFLATSPSFCDDGGGDCKSYLGNVIPEWSGGLLSVAVPILFAVAGGCLIWWVLGLTPLRVPAKRRTDELG